MTEFHAAFNKFLLVDATRVFQKYSAFWKQIDLTSATYDVVLKVIPQYTISIYDVVAMLNYYREEARSKDTKRIFSVVVRELVEDHGYSPEVCHALAIWYFLIVLVPEYNRNRPINETTDVYGMLLCYLNTGEIDLEHEW